MKKKAFRNDMSYVEAIQNGLIDYKDIDDYIVAWHQSNSTKTVYEYLGMTKEQYFKFGTENYKALREMFPKNK